MLVTDDAVKDGEDGGVIAQAEIVTERSFWYKCTPKSKSGKFFCFAAFLTLSGIATTGIVCGSGVCSPRNAEKNEPSSNELALDPASNETNLDELALNSVGNEPNPDELPADPNEVSYNESFIRLPNNTINSLKNSSSPQARAYRWLEESAEVYELETALEWRKHQLFAMATFFYAMGGEFWPDRQLWLQASADECDWMPYASAYNDPIGCRWHYPSDCDLHNSSSRPQDLPCDIVVLTSLTLAGFPVGSTIPPEIELLSSLQMLVITRIDNDNNTMTQLEQFLPSQVGHMQVLGYLDLSYNGFTGGIVSELGMLPLNELHLEGNDLTGPVPTELWQLVNLTSLYLPFDRLTSSIPSELGMLGNLAFLHLNEYFLTGPIPSELGMMKNLHGLYLQGNSLVGPIPSQLGMLRSLSYLHLSDNSINSSIPSELGMLQSLWTLELDNNSLTGVIPSELGMLSFLESLALDNNALTGSVPSELGMQSHLRSSSFYYNVLSGPIPSELGMLHALQYLHLDNNALTGPIPSELGMLQALKHVHLHNNSLTGPVPSELGMLEPLQHLNLSTRLIQGRMLESALSFVFFMGEEPTSEPTQEAIYALLERSIPFHRRLFEEQYGGDFIFDMRYKDSTFTLGADVPVKIEFDSILTSQDGPATLASANDMFLIMSTADYQEYITQYVWTLYQSTFFEQVQVAVFTGQP